jgi:hypothetical protein
LRVLARIEVLSEAEAGRDIVRRLDYWPNHRLDPAEGASLYIGQIELEAGEELVAGDCKERIVNFVSDDLVRPLLRPGVEWQIEEGRTLIARATLLAILE